MVKHVEMQKSVHFTIVCVIFLIGFKKTLQRSMYVNPYNGLNKTDIPCEEREINMSTFLGHCLQLLWLVETFINTMKIPLNKQIFTKTLDFN